MITQFELGWLCGLLEGEGCFGYYASTQSVNLRMVDFDVMNRAAKALEEIVESEVVVRSIDMNYKDADRQTVYYLQLYGARARAVMKVVVPFMGWRRRQRIWRALNKYRAKANVVDILSLSK